MSKARNLSLLSTVEAGATTDQTKADLNAIGVSGGRKNLIINGGMQVAQRGTSLALTTNGYLIDRWKPTLNNTTSAFTVTQSTDSPDEFAYSQKLDCTTAHASLAANSNLYIDHRLEGQNLQGLAFGTSSAKSLTASFWVKSNKTGTYICWIYISNAGKHISRSYTIDTADTWEKKTVTIEGNTSTVIPNVTGIGLYLRFVIATGTDYSSGTQPTTWSTDSNVDRYAGQSVNLADSTANYMNITGVQLELGSVATDFEHRSYGEELALCQRYYYKVLGLMSSQSTRWLSGYQHITLWHPVIMRANPTFSDSGGSSYTLFAEGATDTPSGQATIQVSSKEVSEVYLPSSHAQKGTFVRFASTSKFYELSAEL